MSSVNQEKSINTPVTLKRGLIHERPLLYMHFCIELTKLSTHEFRGLSVKFKSTDNNYNLK